MRIPVEVKVYEIRNGFAVGSAMLHLAAHGGTRDEAAGAFTSLVGAWAEGLRKNGALEAAITRLGIAADQEAVPGIEVELLEGTYAR